MTRREAIAAQLLGSTLAALVAEGRFHLLTAERLKAHALRAIAGADELIGAIDFMTGNVKAADLLEAMRPACDGCGIGTPAALCAECIEAERARADQEDH